MIPALTVLVAAPLAVSVLAVVLPLRLTIRLGTDPARTDLRLAPFGGALGAFRLPRGTGHRSAPTHPGMRSGRRRQRMLRALPQVLAALVHHVRIDRLSVAARFGTGDPAATGQIYGQLMPLVHSPFLPQAAEIRLSPVFDRACLSGDAEVVLRVLPIRLVGPLIRLARAGYGRG